jgi:hypothetical protein
MRCLRFGILVFAPLLAASAVPAAAEDISGTIATTKVIVEDSRLVGDVTCTMTTTPCIQFGAILGLSRAATWSGSTSGIGP